ncbi:MAG: hypothetical protein JHC33_05775 [Ignisphaera sp.]|nr:hypothetical protein [Ignisphaera sp.]
MNVAVCLYGAVANAVLALIAIFLIVRESSKEKSSEAFEKILAVVVVIIVVTALVCLVYSMVDYLLSDCGGCGYDYEEIELPIHVIVAPQNSSLSIVHASFLRHVVTHRIANAILVIGNNDTRIHLASILIVFYNSKKQPLGYCGDTYYIAPPNRTINMPIVWVWGTSDDVASVTITLKQVA